MQHNFFAYSLLVLVFFIGGCSTETVNSPAITPLTSTTSDLFNAEVTDLNNYFYAKGPQLES